MPEQAPISAAQARFNVSSTGPEAVRISEGLLPQSKVYAHVNRGNCSMDEWVAFKPKTLIEPGPLFGCPKCDYTSERRDA